MKTSPANPPNPYLDARQRQGHGRQVTGAELRRIAALLRRAPKETPDDSM